MWAQEAADVSTANSIQGTVEIGKEVVKMIKELQ